MDEMTLNKCHLSSGDGEVWRAVHRGIRPFVGVREPDDGGNIDPGADHQEKRAAMNAYQRALRADPEKRAAYNARRRARYADPEIRAAHNAHKLELARARGVRPKTTMIGPRHPRFAGGRFCFCQVCGKPLGWRCPSRIGLSGTFCLRHRRVVRMRAGKKGK